MEMKTLEQDLRNQIAEKQTQIEELTTENELLFSTIEAILLEMVPDEEE